MSTYFRSHGKASRRWVTSSLIILALLVPTSLFIGRIPVAYAATSSSWNPHVSCQAVVTTDHGVIGNHFNATTEGALESGGPFGVLATQVDQQNTPADLQPDLNPPCTYPNVNGTMAPTFVELHGISLTTGSIVEDSSLGGKCGTKYQPINGGGLYPGGSVYCTAYGVFQDTSVYTGNCETLDNPNPKICIRLEIDRDWMAAGFCGAGTVCDNSTFDKLTPSQKIDVQGFVAWHPPSSSGHGYSSWELHPLTAWKLSPTSALTPAFTWTPTKPIQGQTVTFSGSATGGMAPYTFKWNFGDGTTATGSPVGHAYVAKGSYTVTLNVTDVNGKSAKVSQTIAIASAVSTSFTYSPSGPGAGTSVSFTATATGGVSPYKFSWGFGDGGSATGSPVSHIFSNVGLYNVTLTSSDSAGHTAVFSNNVTVVSPDFKLVAKPTLLTVPLGKNAQSQIAATSLAGFQGTVSFTTSVSSPGLTVTMQALSVKLAAGQTVNDNVIIAATNTSPTGVYIVTVTGTSGLLVHSVNVTVRVPDFSVTANPATLNASPGSTGSSQITFTSLYGFQGGISTQLSVNPAGPKVALNPNNPSLTVNATVISVLSIQVPSNQAAGVYNVTIKATSGPLIHLLVVQVHIGQHTSATVVSCSPNSVIANQASTCTAIVNDTSTISPITPTGTVTFAETGPAGSFSTSTCALVSGSCSVTFTPTATGTALITGAYGGDSAHATSTSLAFSVTVTTVPLHNTATTVTCVSPVLVYQGSLCTATVTDTNTSSTTPTGSVSFTETGPSGSFSPITCTLSSGSCSVTFTPSASGSALVTGTYGGDSSHGGSTSASASVSVNPRATSTSVVCSSPVVVNQASSCTATVSDTSPGTAVIPTGNVSFARGGSCTLVSGSCSVSITPSASGSFLVSVNYAGDSSHSTSSGSTTVAVGDRATSTSVSCSPSSVTNNTATSCVATVTDTDVGGVITPAGSVGFVSNSTGVFAQPSCALAATGTVGVASCSVNYTPGVTGSHTITVSYPGDSSHLSSGGSVIVIVVSGSPTPSYALVVSTDGKVSRLYQNGTVTLIGQPVTTPLRSVAWKPDGSYALISGDNAVLLKYDGTTLTTITTGISSGFNFWTVSWKPDGSYALVGGTVGILFQYDGVKVTMVNNPFSTTILSISWNPSGSYALLVGKTGLALTYDGTTVRSFSTGTTFDLETAAWNPNGVYALIGGLNQTLLQFNGTQVSSINTSIIPAGNAIRSISFNPSGLALLAGDNGMVLTYDGSTLTMLSTVTFSWLYSINWSPSGTAYIVGGAGAILSYSNGVLTSLPGGGTTQFRGIAWKPQ